jgi:sugar lactone lactonase YvrE
VFSIVKSGRIFLAVLAAAASAPSRPESVSAKDRAHEAHLAKDYPAYLKYSLEALRGEPDDAVIRYAVACAESLNGQLEPAARDLQVLVGRGVDFGIETNPELAAVRASPGFDRVRRALDVLKQPVGRAELSFSLRERDLLTEGLAYDPKTGCFFISSVHRRKIVVREPSGRVSDFAPEGKDGLLGVLGMRVDASRRRLWVTVTALPEVGGLAKDEENRSGVFAYDLDTRKLVAKVWMPTDGKRHAANDLAVDSVGAVYLADSRGGVWRLSSDGAMIEEFLSAEKVRSAQGLALSQDESRLYVADYGVGIHVVDIGSRTLKKLVESSSTVLLGVDGLVADGSSLVATLNLYRPYRVVRLELNGAGDRVERSEVLLMNDPRVTEPTLGVVADGFFHFIANSAWDLFDEKTGRFLVDRLEDPVILKIRLPRPSKTR